MSESVMQQIAELELELERAQARLAFAQVSAKRHKQGHARLLARLVGKVTAK